MTSMNHRPMPSQTILEETFDYDPITGILAYKHSKKPVSIKGPHPRAKVERKMWILSRIIWTMVTGNDPAEMVIDHIDNNPKNNAFQNLRLCTRQENLMNRKTHKNNTLGIKGVTQTGRNRYVARCSGEYLGTFPNKAAAQMAYIRSATEKHGQFAKFQ